MAGDCFMPDTL